MYRDCSFTTFLCTLTAVKQWAQPLMSGAATTVYQRFPIAFHCHVVLERVDNSWKILDGVSDQQLCERIRNVLVDPENIQGALAVLEDAKVPKISMSTACTFSLLSLQFSISIFNFNTITMGAGLHLCNCVLPTVFYAFAESSS